jgi:hypothetical protein
MQVVVQFELTVLQGGAQFKLHQYRKCIFADCTDTPIKLTSRPLE